jgi:hypothetical protein
MQRTSDEATYRRLVEEGKNERLEFLLRKTDEYVSNMRATVEQHQFRQLSVGNSVLSSYHETLVDNCGFPVNYCK